MLIWPYKEVKKVDAVEYLKNFNKMCESYGNHCYHCPISKINNCTEYLCSDYTMKYPEKVVQIVEQWIEEQKNTRQKEFLKIYPNVDKSDGIIKINPCILDIDYKKEFCDNYTLCKECRKDYWLKEIDKKIKNF